MSICTEHLLFDASAVVRSMRFACPLVRVSDTGGERSAAACDASSPTGRGWTGRVTCQLLTDYAYGPQSTPRLNHIYGRLLYWRTISRLISKGIKLLEQCSTLILVVL
ncbi:hypothetical protein EVAR_67514_1 [Eumeta japonica]|uniref:Uncharacterized protein n=1 Tax=Eumeta variegata TaxID=151549 RepID=A0A4C1YWZ2_EUMVA|nr:hypothetical protein EVAR_67514_1 [Eumeta japonica]